MMSFCFESFLKAFAVVSIHKRRLAGLLYGNIILYSRDSSVELTDLVAYLLDRVFGDRNEAFHLATEVVNVSGVDVEPERMDVEVVLLESALKEPIGCYILELLKCVDLR